MSEQTSSPPKRLDNSHKLAQLEKYVKELESKNKSLMAKCIDLHKEKKKLVQEKEDLAVKLQLHPEPSTSRQEIISCDPPPVNTITIAQGVRMSTQTNVPMCFNKAVQVEEKIDDNVPVQEPTKVTTEYQIDEPVEVAGGSLTEEPIKITKQLQIEEVTKVVQECEQQLEELNTEQLVALWDEISRIPLPSCACSKSQVTFRRRSSDRKTKFKACERIRMLVDNE